MYYSGTLVNWSARIFSDMQASTTLRFKNIDIRTEFRPGDLGYLVYLHGKLYYEEYGYGLPFESYVASSLHEFYEEYNPEKERAWICEHDNQMIGFLSLKNRGAVAQLRYFILLPVYRGMGLGSYLMQLYMDFMRQCGYRSAYLLTTSELGAALHLYQKFGFCLVEEQTSDAFGKPVVMQRYEMTL